MCFVSAVFDQFNPHIPDPYKWQPVQPVPTVPQPNTFPVVPVSPAPQINQQPTVEQLRELIDVFHKAVEAAKTFDRLTGQPDCEDPEKAKLVERVAELERRIAELEPKPESKHLRDVYRAGAPATTKRRDDLLDWVRERSAHQGLTAREIADVSGIYDRLQGRQEKCSGDLRILAKAGFVRTDRNTGGRWWPL